MKYGDQITSVYPHTSHCHSPSVDEPVHYQLPLTFSWYRSLSYCSKNGSSYNS